MDNKDLEKLGFKEVKFLVNGIENIIYRLYIEDNMLDIKNNKDLQITHRLCVPPLISKLNDLDIYELKEIIEDLKRIY